MVNIKFDCDYTDAKPWIAPIQPLWEVFIWKPYWGPGFCSSYVAYRMISTDIMADGGNFWALNWLASESLVYKLAELKNSQQYSFSHQQIIIMALNCYVALPICSMEFR